MKLSLMSRGHVFGLEDAIFGGDRARRLTSIVCNSERGFLLEIQAVVRYVLNFRTYWNVYLEKK